MKHEKQIIDKLLHRDIKPTAMRILVLDMLLKQEYAISLNDLEMMFDKADRVTLFRTLKTFEKHRLIHRIDDGTGAFKYALCNDACDCTPEEFHVHFHCIGCKKTYCLPDSPVPGIRLPKNFKMQEMNIVIKGWCEKCSSISSSFDQQVE